MFNLVTGLRDVLIGVFALYVVVLAGLFLLQRSFLYQPSGGRIEPAVAGLPQAREVVLDAADGEKIIAWHMQARSGKPTLLYFHGNGGNLANRVARFQLFEQEGWGIFAMSYRSYSGSTGRPSEVNNVADALQAYDALRGLGTRPSDIVVYGESLGTGIAVQVAGQKQVAGLVLDAPYTSMAAVAQGHYPIFPVNLLILDRYDSDRHIAKVNAPILILHGELDAVIPVAHGRVLAAAAPDPKTLEIFPNGQHENLPHVGGIEVVRVWLAQTVLGQRVPQG